MAQPAGGDGGRQVSAGMPKASLNSPRSDRAKSSGRIIDRYAIVAIAASSYASIGSPLLIYITTVPNTDMSFAGSCRA